MTNLVLGSMGLAASLVGGPALAGGICPPENVVKSDQKAPVVARVIASRVKAAEGCEAACGGGAKSALTTTTLATLMNAKGADGCKTACGGGEKTALTATTLAALMNAKGGTGCEAACGGDAKSSAKAAFLATYLASALKGACPPEGAAERNVVFSLSPRIVDGELTLSASGLPEELTKAFTLCPPGEIDGAVVNNLLLSLRPMIADGKLTLSVVGECPPEQAKAGDAATPVPTFLRLLGNAQAQPGQSRFEIKTLNGDDKLHVVIKDGEVVTSERNGFPIKIEMDRDEDGNIKSLKDEYGNVLWEGGGLMNGHDVIIDAHGQPLTYRYSADSPHAQWLGQVQGAAPGNGTWVLGQAEGGAPAGGTWWQTTPQPAEQPKAMLGVVLGEPDAGLMKHFGLEAGQATVLTNVYPGFPAGDAGIEAYDIVVGVNGSGTATPDEIRAALREANAGDRVRLTVIHRGERREVTVRLQPYDQERLGEASRAHGAESPAGGTFQLAVPPPPPVPGMAPLAPSEPGQLRLERRMLNDGDVVIRRREAMAERDRAMAEAERAMAQMRDGMMTREQELHRTIERHDGDADDRMRRLEDRLERLERMLQRMVEREENTAPRGTGRRS